MPHGFSFFGVYRRWGSGGGRQVGRKEVIYFGFLLGGRPVLISFLSGRQEIDQTERVVRKGSYWIGSGGLDEVLDTKHIHIFIV